MFFIPKNKTGLNNINGEKVNNTIYYKKQHQMTEIDFYQP